MVKFHECLIDEAVAVPFVFFTLHFRQVDRFFHQASEYTRLRECLPVHLSDPCGRAVGRNDDKRHLLVECFGYGWVDIEQGCT